MSRTQRSHPEIRKKIAKRFVKAFEVGMGLTTAEISRRLGYANPTTVQAIKRGDALPDFARIALHCEQLRDRRGGTLNLHWLITGEGVPFFKGASDARLPRQESAVDDDIIILMSSMSARQKSALTRFLAEIG
jgi:hypothetical protein